MHDQDHDTGAMTVSESRDDRGTRAPDPDRALFAAFLAGDDRALATLFDRHNERLFRYCVQRIGDPARAEDITQELWERLLRLRTNGRMTAENPLGFLFRVVRNLCIDEQRRQRGHISIEFVGEEHHPTVAIPELSHLEEMVLLALPHLPADQREVIILHEYSGYSYDEVAAMLGESAGTVRTRAWRGRAHLGRVIAAMLGMRDRPEEER
jgi:RNA polymerase sigma-70 factor (ECF subfamily)